MRFVVVCLLALALVGCSAPSAKQSSQVKQQAEVHYKMGVSHLQSDNPTLALKEFLTAAEQDPKNSAVQAGLAQAYQAKKSYVNAERHYLKALELSDNDPRYQNNLATLYLDMKQWDKAIEYFDKAASNLLFLSPQVALTGKGYAYLRKKDYPEALSQFDQAIAMSPGYAPAYFLQSEVYRETGKDHLARLALEQTLSRAPLYTQANYQLGILLLKDNEIEEAKRHFKTVIESSPESEWAAKSAEILKSLPAE